MDHERLELRGYDRAIYFAPSILFGFLAALCAAFTLASLFAIRISNPLAVTAAGLFGLVITAGLGSLLFRAQLKDLRYLPITTPTDAAANYEAVASMARRAGWEITRDEPARRLDARVAGSVLSQGEFVSVFFRGGQVLVASVCDPHIGFSLVGRRRSRQHGLLVKCVVTELTTDERQVFKGDTGVFKRAVERPGDERGA